MHLGRNWKGIVLKPSSTATNKRECSTAERINLVIILTNVKVNKYNVNLKITYQIHHLFSYEI